MRRAESLGNFSDRPHSLNKGFKVAQSHLFFIGIFELPTPFGGRFFAHNWGFLAYS